MANYALQPSSLYARTHGLFSLVAEVSAVRGEIVECGVGRGISLAALVYAVSFSRLRKVVYGFDSFSGFPSAAVQDLGRRVKETDKAPSGWTDTSPELITSIFEFDRASAESLLRQHDVAVEIIPGFFQDTLAAKLPNEIALLHIDCDLYDSTKTVLEQCLPRLSPGGIVVFDEYHDERWPGAKRAADEVCAIQGLEVTYFGSAARFGVRMPSAAEGQPVA